MSGAQLDEVLRLLWWSLVHYYYYFLLLLCVASGSHASLTATFSAKDRTLCVCVCVCPITFGDTVKKVCHVCLSNCVPPGPERGLYIGGVVTEQELNAF